jgi:hypothetical protein
LSRKQIWTPAARDLLFETLVAKFGPYSTRKKVDSPGNGKDAAFKKFCREFADVVGANSWEAVKHQIAWGSPTRAGGLRDWISPGHAYNAILNPAALDAGFIRRRDLPSLLAEGKYERET